jgi:hypothetical protein
VVAADEYVQNPKEMMLSMLAWLIVDLPGTVWEIMVDL